MMIVVGLLSETDVCVAGQQAVACVSPAAAGDRGGLEGGGGGGGGGGDLHPVQPPD